MQRYPTVSHRPGLSAPRSEDYTGLPLLYPTSLGLPNARLPQAAHPMVSPLSRLQKLDLRHHLHSSGNALIAFGRLNGVSSIDVVLRDGSSNMLASAIESGQHNVSNMKYVTQHTSSTLTR